MRLPSPSLLFACLCLLPGPRAAADAVPAPEPAAPAPDVVAPAAPRMEISCYFPSWAESAERVPYAQLDQIYYAFLRPTPVGDFEPLGNPDVLKDLVRRSHEAGVKVSIAVGGGLKHVAPVFATVAADPELRAVFIRNLAAFVDEYALDGVDIDWEYPVAGVSDIHCGLLIQELAATFRPKGKLLSMAVPGHSRKPNYPDAIFPLLDYLNVMSYDHGRPAHATLEYARAGIAYWTARGCPPEKLMLGVPFYSRSTTAEPIAYRKLRELGADAEADLFTTADNHVHGYNGRATLRAKVALARESGVRGIMIWQSEQDTRGEDSLLTALHDAIANPPPAAEVAPIVSTPDPVAVAPTP